MAEHSLGKGEVESSILSASSIDFPAQLQRAHQDSEVPLKRTDLAVPPRKLLESGFRPGNRIRADCSPAIAGRSKRGFSPGHGLGQGLALLLQVAANGALAPGITQAGVTQW